MLEKHEGLVLTAMEAQILKQFLWLFKYALAAYLRESPRPSPQHEYLRRMEDPEAQELFRKFGLGEFKP